MMRTTSAPYIVLCARCEQPWPETDPGVTYREGDWWCWNETECDDRRIEDTPAEGHPDGF
jgi:hypothetical protein